MYKRKERKFIDETFLSIFKGSLSKANPLKRFTWASAPQSMSIVKPIKGECEASGVLHLSFDGALRTEIEGVRTALMNRGKSCNKPCMFGYGGQYAYYHYLNYFMEHSKFRFRYDCVYGSAYGLPHDFRIFFPTHRFWIEVKTSPPNMSYCRYYKIDPNPFPEWVVYVKALDEEMLNYELYGYCEGLHVQTFERKLRYGKPCYEIPANRDHFNPYIEFHNSILRLPYLEKFDTEHYV